MRGGGLRQERFRPAMSAGQQNFRGRIKLPTWPFPVPLHSYDQMRPRVPARGGPADPTHHEVTSLLRDF